MRKLYVTCQMQEFPDGDNVFGLQLLDLRNVDAAGYDLIEVSDTLDFLPYINRINTLNLLISKLRHKGSMTILGSDLNLVTMAYQLKNIDEVQLNNLLFGDRKSTGTNSEVVKVLESAGLKILRNRVYDYKWQVTAERP
jgi:hypothetical protein